MKITSEHYAILAAAIDLVMAKYPNIENTYVENGLSKKRFRWDILRASGLLSNSEFMNNIYNYLNDEHIDTALQHYFGYSK